MKTSEAKDIPLEFNELCLHSSLWPPLKKKKKNQHNRTHSGTSGPLSCIPLNTWLTITASAAL